MKKLIVNGGVPLCGEVRVAGSKNAALPILLATMATHGVSIIRNVPDIGDVRVAIELLRSFGAVTQRRKDTLTVDTRNLEYKKPSPALTSKIRASTYLLGACLSRFGICHILPFGGCDFAKRPIDLHLYAASTLGADIEEEYISAKRLCAAQIRFPKISVGATVNALIMCSGIDGVSEIHSPAIEPHVMNLIDYLRSAGAEIDICEKYIKVRGGKLLSGDVRVIGDMIEAGTYAAAAMVTSGDVTVRGCNPEELSAFNKALIFGGADVETSEDGVHYFGKFKKELEIEAAPYPGFPTDLQPIFSVILASGAGGRIKDSVFETRFGYLDELSKFGIISSVNFSCAHIYPQKPLFAAAAFAPDLRGGAACLMAALSALGQSRIMSAEKIFRGYENIAEKLSRLGAKIEIR